ncbi:MAG: tyrosine-type recombinase/integrase, partial [Nitrososphaerales archaeon]
MTDTPMPRATLSEVEAFNSQWIQRYIDAEKRGVTLGRRKRIRLTLGKLGRLHLNKRFDQVTKDELQEFVDSLKDDSYDDPRYPESYSDETKRSYLKIAKPFFKWLHKLDDPEFASWIKTGSYRTTVGPEDIFTEAELNQMRDACKTPRDKAMLETLFESARRPKEFLSLRRGDIEFDKDCVTLHIRKGKTGFPRDVVLIGAARPLLTRWILNEHPLRSDSDFSVWIDMSKNTTHEPLQQLGLRKFIARTAEQSRIKKRAYPYMMRHSRLTDLARLGANEAMLCEIAGWKQGSKMPSVYIHFSGRDQKPALMKLYGIQPEEPKEARPLTKKCPACNEVNT